MKNILKTTILTAILAGFIAQPVNAMETVQKTPTWKKAAYIIGGLALVGGGIYYVYTNYKYAYKPYEFTDEDSETNTLYSFDYKDKQLDEDETPSTQINQNTDSVKTTDPVVLQNDTVNKKKPSLNSSAVEFFTILEMCLGETRYNQTVNKIKSQCAQAASQNLIIAVFQYKSKTGKTLKEMAAKTIYASDINELYEEYGQ